MRYWNLIKYLSNWWLHFAVKFSLTTADPLIFKTRQGIEVEAPRRLLHEFKEIFLENTYFSDVKKLPEKPTIVDIGANVGFFSLFAASLFPKSRMYAFEPVPENFQQLCRNRGRNMKADISCFPVAVCGHDGEIFLNFELENNFTTSATIIGDSCSGKGVTVPCASLATIFSQNGITSCDLLKLDCEGAEFDILYNSPREDIEKIKQIAMEVHNGKEEGQSIQFLASWLEGHGFMVKYKGQMLWALRG